LHACDIADALGMPAVIVPARAGVLSAVGMAGAPRQHEAVRSWSSPASVDGLAAALDELAAVARHAVATGPEAGAVPSVATFVDCRYAGQSHELTVADVESFHGEHERRNGYARPTSPIEVVALRARAWLDAPVAVRDLAPVERQRVVGPVVLVEPDCTIVVPSGWVAEPGEGGALVMRRR
jgi:N-methylhydantoinase A/oxoprolinase/acetone carboxylase beta subunit